VIEGSQTQAIKTERMKLRYDITLRRVKEFDRSVVDFRMVLESDESGVEHYESTAFSHSLIAVALAAGLVIGMDADLVQDKDTPVGRFMAAGVKLRAAGKAFASSPRQMPINTTDYGRDLVQAQSTMLMSLHDLHRDVDQKAEARIGNPT